MFKNYLKVTFRHLQRHPLYVFVNVVGLGLAVTFTLVGYLMYRSDRDADRRHVKSDRVYRVMSYRGGEDTTRLWGVSPLPLGPAAAADLPGVVRSVRYSMAEINVRRGDDEVRRSLVAFADTGFFEAFDFPAGAGTVAALRRQNQVILSDKTAEAFFGPEDPIGQTLTLLVNDSLMIERVVGAVLDQVSSTANIQFDLLLPYETILTLYDRKADDWADIAEVTFLELDDPSRAATVEAGLQRYLPLRNEATPEWTMSRLTMVPFAELSRHTRAGTVSYNILRGGLPASAFVFSITAGILTLLIACFNFINTSLATVGRRVKEIGVRKALGVRRRQLVAQMLGETGVICLLGVLAGVLFAELYLPYLNRTWSFLALDLDVLRDYRLVLFLVALFVATTLLAGVYPAFYITRFRPDVILRGRQRFGGSNALTRVLLTFQFTLAVTSLVLALTFVRNASYQENFKLGYDHEVLLETRLRDGRDYVPLRQALAREGAVVDIAGSHHHIERSSITRVARRGEQTIETNVYDVGPNYLPTVGIAITAGQDFPTHEDAARRTDEIIVSQGFVDAFGLDEPMGARVVLDSTAYFVRAVTQNFHQFGLWQPVKPTVFRLTTPDQYRYLTTRVTPGQTAAFEATVKEHWKALFPDRPYVGGPQSTSFFQAQEITRNIRNDQILQALVVLFLSVSGLFALVSLDVLKRLKEISIRKVLGASSGRLVLMLNRPLGVMLLIASVVGGIGGWFGGNAFLGSIYTYHTQVGPEVLLGAGGVLLVVAALTVGWKVYQAVTANPADTLRNE